MLYMGCLNRKLGKIVYIDKRYLQTVEHNIEFNQTLFNELINEFKLVYMYILEHKLPPKLMSYPTSQQCQYCTYSNDCKGDINV